MTCDEGWARTAGAQYLAQGTSTVNFRLSSQNEKWSNGVQYNTYCCLSLHLAHCPVLGIIALAIYNITSIAILDNLLN